MHSKKGQITAFIVIGIILVILVSLFLFVQQKVETRKLETAFDESGLPSDVVMVKNYVEMCLEKSAAPGVFLLGLQGGYIYEKPENLFQTEFASIAYGIYEGKKELLTYGYMEDEISRFVEESFQYCINDFVMFDNKGFKIKGGKPKATTRIEKNMVKILLEFPLSIKTKSMNYEITNFAAAIPVRAGHVIETADEIIQHQINSEESSIDFRYLTGFDVYVSVLPFEKDTTLITLHDSNSSVDGSEFEFMFAINDNSKNNPPRLDFIPNKVLTVGREYRDVIFADDIDNEKITYSSDSSIFTVNPENGSISVIPLIKGEYVVTFRATDPHGSYSEQSARFVVELPPEN